MYWKMKTAAIAFALSPLLGFAHSAHSDEEGNSVSRAVDYRTSYMTVVNWNARPMMQMLKGEADFDEAAFMSHATQLATIAQLDFLTGFPEGSATDDSDAREEIWFDWDDFEQKFADFQSAAKTLGEQAATGDLEATKQAFGTVGDACKACHKAYKE